MGAGRSEAPPEPRHGVRGGGGRVASQAVDPALSPPQPRSPGRRTLVLIVVPILVVVVVGTLGNMFHAPLLKDHPLWLVAMEPRNRFLLLVAEKVSFWPFLAVATIRRLVSDPLFYLLGYLYGDRGVRWMERKMGEGGGLVRAIERGFSKAAPVMVFLFPGAIVCVLAGATGMSPLLFLALNLLGTVTVVTLLFRLAEVLDGPLGAVNRFYGNNTRTLLVISIVVTIYWFWDQRRRGRSELQSISSIEKELEGDELSDDQPAEDEASAEPEAPPEPGVVAAAGGAEGPTQDEASAESQAVAAAGGAEGAPPAATEKAHGGGRSGSAGRPEHD